MPPRRPSIAQRKLRLRARKFTSKKAEFAQMRQWFPDRLNILAEGDSWFAYPPDWIVAGKPSNRIYHLSHWTRYKANFYSMASNGDEAVAMVSGKQKHDLIEVLRWHTKGSNRRLLDLILFSGGGNDIVGKSDLERFLRPRQNGNTARHWVHLDRLQRKARQIGLAYEELIDIRDHYSPETAIVTHTYDYPYASLTGGIFLAGLIETKGWMKRFMEDINIPEKLQTGVIRIFIDEMAAVSRQIEVDRDKFYLVDTIGTLLNRADWLNEIHPTSDGFETLASRIWERLRQIFPQLTS